MATTLALNGPVFCLQSDFGDRKMSWELWRSSVLIVRHFKGR
jgi:hypothetical protein